VTAVGLFNDTVRLVFSLISELTYTLNNAICCTDVVFENLTMYYIVKFVMVVTWLILPVVICLSQRLSHACLSISLYMVRLRMAH
jgi:hypothetical protein